MSSAVPDPRRRRVPPGRYGEVAGPGRRRLTVAAVGLLAALGVALAVAVALHVSGRDVQAGVRAFTVVSAERVDVTFEVRLPAGRAADCVVRARGRDGAEVGREQVAVGPAPDGKVVTTYSLRTRGRAVTGEVVGCRLAGSR